MYWSLISDGIDRAMQSVELTLFFCIPSIFWASDSGPSLTLSVYSLHSTVPSFAGLHCLIGLFVTHFDSAVHINVSECVLSFKCLRQLRNRVIGHWYRSVKCICYIALIGFIVWRWFALDINGYHRWRVDMFYSNI